jgi:aminopeptidase N
LLSLGRRFSAPAHFKTQTSRAGRAKLMALDGDDFNRWEAGQTLATEILSEMTKAAAGGAKPIADRAYLDALESVLAHAADDPALAALMLTPPLENELAHSMSPPDPDAIHAARVALIRQVAARYGSRIAQLYAAMAGSDNYTPDAEQAGRRALRNSCLRYLTSSDDEDAAVLADEHYRGASNMTDMIAGLAALTRINSSKRDAAFAHFESRFRNDPLVLDKWMSLQAGSPLPETVNGVRALTKHPAFDMRNPNRVRALIGAFSGNHLRFHAADGSGYALVAEMISALDKINPQVAARLAGAFEAWRRYDPARQKLMRGHLESISKMSGLSPNLFEVTSKMVG